MSDDVGFLLRGGPVMWPLFLCGLVSVAVMIERFLAIGAAVRDNETLMLRIAELLKAGEASAALEFCEKSPGRIAKMVAGGLRTTHLDHGLIERSMEEMALKELPALYDRLSVLDTIVTLAPLLGLLGTVTGMIHAFHVVGSAAGLNNPNAITGGVSEALVATSAGLTIAIVTLPAYNFLTERVKQNVGEMELRAAQFLNVVAVIKQGEAHEAPAQ
jgi:biopolymer transport protein ExbB